MLVNKTFKFRAYPDKPTVDTFDRWNCALKYLWNLSHEQRKIGISRPRGEKIYPSYFSQNRELTDLRKQADWVAEVPRHICSQILMNLDLAWKRWFDGLSNAPKWKKKSSYLSFTETDPKVWSLRGNRIKFPKLPLIPIVLSRPLEGKAKTCTIKRDGDQWFIHIVCEVNLETPAPRAEPKVGIDRGVRNIIGDSNGRLVPNPKFMHKELARLAKQQRTANRRKKGSKNQQKAYNRINRTHRKIRRQRDHFMHVESSNYAKSHGVVVMENLNTSGMVKGYLSRQISDSGWGKLFDYLAYKLQWSGGNLYEVPAHYTSQTCAACEHIDGNSRCGDQFKCTKCGYLNHADLNAAIIILRRWSPSSQPVEGSSQRATRRSRKFTSPDNEVMD